MRTLRSLSLFRRIPEFVRGGLAAFCASTICLAASAQIGGSGWRPYPVVFKVQWPTNAPESARYFATNNIYHCLVFSNDGAFAVSNTTLPRTEQRFEPDYTNGEIQYQASIMAPSNENSYCVFQIHTGDAQSTQYGSTTFMLFWFTNSLGSVRDYSGTVLVTNLGNRWFQLNVDHNLVSRGIKVWINQSLVWTQQDNGAGDFYFKDGVYEQSHGPTLEMDTYVTNILMWTNSGTTNSGSLGEALTWTGQTNGVNVGIWDLGITADWVNSTNSSIQTYQDGGTVSFDDNAPGATTVNLQALVQPASVSVSNNTKAYTFTGTGGLGGAASVAKYGGGPLTVETSNSFSGGLTITGGILQAGNGAALGATSGATFITNGGSLDVNGFNLTPEPVTVSGSGPNGNGAIINSGAPQTSALRTVTLAGNTTFGGSSRWDIRDTGGSASLNTSPSGSVFNILKTGTNQVSLVGVGSIDSALGNIEIQQGIFAVQTSTVQLGDATKTLTVDSGATLDLWTLTSSPLNKQIVLSNGATVFNEKGPSTIIGSITLQGAATFSVTTSGTPATLTVSNGVSGAGSLILTGGGNLVLAGANDYTGNTTVSQGTLSLSGAGSISGSVLITLAAAATLDASVRSDSTLTVANAQTLTGDGTVSGNVIVESGATLMPGGSLTTLTFNTNLTLNGGSTTVLELSTAALTNDAAQVKGALDYGGTLAVTNLSGHALAAGDAFKLFSAASYSGSFANVLPPTPGSGLAWNLAALTNGMLTVVAATAPQLTSSKFVGDDLVVAGSGGSAYAGYYVLTSTNLKAPLNQWTRLATNSFDANGNFTFTNAPSPNWPQAFYQLELQ